MFYKRLSGGGKVKTTDSYVLLPSLFNNKIDYKLRILLRSSTYVLYFHLFGVAEHIVL